MREGRPGFSKCTNRTSVRAGDLQCVALCTPLGTGRGSGAVEEGGGRCVRKSWFCIRREPRQERPEGRQLFM